MAESMYTPPDLMVVKKRRQGQKLVVFGAIAAAIGCVGALLSMVLKVVWLGLLGGTDRLPLQRRLLCRRDLSGRRLHAGQIGS